MRRFLCAAIAALLAVPGCARQADDGLAPVASPSFSADRERAPLGSPVEVTYRFVVAQNAEPLDENYRVLVHFLDADDELMWTDDHDPPVPTKEWRAGQTIEYTRTMFVPIYPYIGQATVRVGLYSERDQRRLPLIGADAGQRAYTVGTLQLLPQSENIFIIFKDGWHRPEVAPDNAAIEWQWTRQDATLAFRHPKRDALFYLQLDGRREAFDEPQRVTLAIGDRPIDGFEISSNEPITRKIPLTAEQMGSEEMVELRIHVDRTFVPAALPAANTSDARELGVRVFQAFVEPR
jgi:hypothetical protein